MQHANPVGQWVEAYATNDPAEAPKYIYEMPWDDPEIVALARKYNDDPEYIWETLSPYAFSFRQWGGLMAAYSYWAEWDITLEDLAQMLEHLGNMSEVNAALMQQMK